MQVLLGVTLAASAVDCLNPIALTQQFILQGLVKKKRDILYFILGTALMNYIFGLLAYYGITTLLRSFWNGFFLQYGHFLLAAEILLGLVCLLLAAHMWHKSRTQSTGTEPDPAQAQQVLEQKARMRGLGPFPLFLTGILFCAFELSSALPYFAFLAFLLRYSLPPVLLLPLLLLYNFIYVSPQLLLYICYSHFQEKIDPFYQKLQRIVACLNNKLAPAAAGIVGILLAIHGIIRFI